MSKDVDKPIKVLRIDNAIILKLENNNIKTVADLWVIKRKELKEMNFSDSEINHIRIKLQLMGIDLNKKTYI